MFDSSTEKKIIEFIKKSPIGVTSSEIARYLHINRITLSKYLSVIKEKALIDFKQLGMAKLWYIPVNISEGTFLRRIINDLAANLEKKDPKSIVNKVGFNVGEHIEELYKGFYGVEKLNLDQFSEVIIDVEKKIGGDFSIVEISKDKVVIKNTKCPFGEGVKKNPNLCYITSNILGVLAAKYFDYGKVCMKKTIATDSDYCDMVVYLKKTKESEKDKGKEYSAEK